MSNREMRTIAEQRMAVLLDLSLKEASAGNGERSRRYFLLARAIGMRTKTPLPRGTLYCRDCQILLVPGRNCQVRLNDGRIVTRCLICKGVRRRPYVSKKGDSSGKQAEPEGT